MNRILKNRKNRFIARAEQRGFRFLFGAEQEFYLFKRDENGEPTKIPYDRAGYMDILYMRFIAERVKKMAAVPEYFGSMVFDDRVMKANLSAEVYQSLKRTIDQGEKLNIGVLKDAFAFMGALYALGGPLSTCFFYFLGFCSLWWKTTPGTTALYPPPPTAGLSWSSPERS